MRFISDWWDNRPSVAMGDPRALPRPMLIRWSIIVTLVYTMLWSHWWYPLSDSSLYLSLARSLATDRGFTFMGDPHRLVPPLGPWIYSLVMRAGGGIGAIQALCTALMLIAHALCFVTLRQWVTPRLALTATLCTALSYWVFYNAFAIMSEPPCLVFFWSGMLTLTRAVAATSLKARWWRVVLAALLLLGAVETRVAAIFLVTGALVALFIFTYRTEKRSTLIQWALLYLVIFGAAMAWYRYPNQIGRLLGLIPATQPTTQQAIQPGINSEYGLDDNGAAVREGRYKTIWLYGVKRDLRHMITDVPALAGQWVIEGLAMPLVVAFRMHGVLRVLVWAGSTLLFAFCLVGLLFALKRRQWWIVGLMPYFLVFWLQWGTRIKPRYMAPITPVLFILLWGGVTSVVTRLRKRNTLESRRWIGQVVAALILIGVLIGNAPAWLMEFYIRHGTNRQFYDVARQGAFAQLVDIGAYLQQHTTDDEKVWVNVGANRRIIYFLGGREVLVPIVGKGRISEVTMSSWPPPTTAPKAGGKPVQSPLEMYLSRLPVSARFAIVYAEPHPWPDWHWPLPPTEPVEGNEYWRLYVRDSHGKFHRVIPPRSRQFVPAIPYAGI